LRKIGLVTASWLLIPFDAGIGQRGDNRGRQTPNRPGSRVILAASLKRLPVSATLSAVGVTFRHLPSRFKNGDLEGPLPSVFTIPESGGWPAAQDICCAIDMPVSSHSAEAMLVLVDARLWVAACSGSTLEEPIKNFPAERNRHARSPRLGHPRRETCPRPYSQDDRAIGWFTNRSSSSYPSPPLG